MQSRVAVEVFRSLALSRLRSDEGQDLLEYGLLAALIALVALSAVSTVGNAINTFFWESIASSSF